MSTIFICSGDPGAFSTVSVDTVQKAGEAVQSALEAGKAVQCIYGEPVLIRKDGGGIQYHGQSVLFEPQIADYVDTPVCIVPEKAGKNG